MDRKEIKEIIKEAPTPDVVGVSDSHKKQVFGSLLNENIKLTGENIKLSYENLILEKKIERLEEKTKVIQGKKSSQYIVVMMA